MPYPAFNFYALLRFRAARATTSGDALGSTSCFVMCRRAGQARALRLSSGHDAHYSPVLHSLGVGGY
jgi:hypothetical protein